MEKAQSEWVLAVCALLAAGACIGAAGLTEPESNSSAHENSRTEVTTGHNVSATKEAASTEVTELDPTAESIDRIDANPFCSNNTNGKKLTAESSINGTAFMTVKEGTSENIVNIESTTTVHNIADSNNSATNVKKVELTTANSYPTNGKEMKTGTSESSLTNINLRVRGGTSNTTNGKLDSNDTKTVLTVGSNVTSDWLMESVVNNSSRSKCSTDWDQGQTESVNSTASVEKMLEMTATNTETSNKQTAGNSRSDKGSETDEMGDTNIITNEGYTDNINSTMACNKSFSVVITKWQIFDNGSLLSLDDNLMLYPPGFFWKEFNDNNSTEVRGCMCVLKNCIRKCCPEEQTITEAGTCVASNSSLLYPFSPQFTDEGSENPVQDADVHTVYGNPCQHGSFRLDPVADGSEQFLLLRSGVLSVPSDGNFTIEGYCIEAFEDEEEILPLLCFPPEDSLEEQNDADVRLIYPVGMIISVAFLFATFVVYAVTPELRNLHGKSLMSHVGSLLTAYSFLAVVQLGSKQISNTFCTFCGKCSMYFDSGSLFTPLIFSNSACRLGYL
jgi:hypothetical protein